MKKFWCLAFAFFMLKVAAQEDDKKTSLTVGAYYQSDMQYLGRKDSVKIPLLVPNFHLHLKNGLFAEAEGYYGLKNSKLEGGYGAIGYETDRENWGGSIALSQYIFDKNTQLVNAGLGTGIDANFYYDFDFITASVEPNFTFGKNGGLVLGAGISKDITVEAWNHDLQFSPKAAFWFGNEAIFLKKTAPAKSMAGSKDFRLMDIEIGVPVSYTVAKFKFFVEPLLAFPENYKQLGGYYASAKYPDPIFTVNLGLSYIFSK